MIGMLRKNEFRASRTSAETFGNCHLQSLIALCIYIYLLYHVLDGAAASSAESGYLWKPAGGISMRKGGFLGAGDFVKRARAFPLPFSTRQADLAVEGLDR
jgi:hypothetical protein